MDLIWLSSDPTAIYIAVVAVLVTLLYYYVQNKDLPPGPIGLPYLGYWPFMKNETCHLQFEAYKKKYGDIFSFTCTGRLYINLCSAKAIREVHSAKGECFGDRNVDFNLLNYVFADGVAFLNGDEWKVQRKFFLQSMKQRGLLSVNEAMSSSMSDAIDLTISELKTMQNQPIEIIKLLTDKCTTIMRLTVFGDVGITDEQIKAINEDYEALMSYMTPTRLLLSGDFARYVIQPLTSGFGQFKSKLQKVKDQLYEIINEHKATYKEDHIRDIIDEYIKERDFRLSKGDPTARFFTDKALMASLIQVLGDGVLSVAMFIGLFIKILLDHPEEQEKIYKELVDVVELDRQPTVEDKSKLTYTNAFFSEGLRTSDFFPFFPSQECTKETTVRGYRIPKGTLTLMSVWSSHLDPNVYEDPEKFNPSRFIHVEGQRKAEPPVTFGMGRRACIGEGFTMMQCFLFLTSLVKNFHIKLPEGGNVTNTYELLLAGKLQILVIPRN